MRRLGRAARHRADLRDHRHVALLVSVERVAATAAVQNAPHPWLGEAILT
jgi:hypothetical protein